MKDIYEDDKAFTNLYAFNNITWKSLQQQLIEIQKKKLGKFRS